MCASKIKPFKETGEHSYHRRAFSHDYFAPFIYHIIIKKAKKCESFGSVEGDARIAPGSPGCIRIVESVLGKIIAKSILHLSYEYPILKLYQFCVMPDHIHLLIQVLYRSDKHLDFYVESLKTRIAAKYSEKKGEVVNNEVVFEPGYCDKPLYDNRSLDGLFRYIRENPHRLGIRLQFPQFFRTVRNFKIGNNNYQAYGNLFLLRNPDKEAVRISRKFTPEEKLKKRGKWLSDVSKGTVLVSPFISREEKEIRTEADSLGGKIILIVPEAFGERYKPAKHDFDLCCEGRIVIISLGLPPKSDLTREVCLKMNELAQLISSL
ncbi:MAG: transposase [Muribaculaceae bacterium]|nr:transposase [Muribaculaceae bacterium]